MTAIHEDHYRTQGGIVVHRSTEVLRPDGAIEPIVDALDVRRGVLMASSYEYPGRYTRWDMGFVDPPLVITSRQRDFQITALNARGTVLLPTLARTLDPRTNQERFSSSPARPPRSGCPSLSWPPD